MQEARLENLQDWEGKAQPQELVRPSRRLRRAVVRAEARQRLLEQRELGPQLDADLEADASEQPLNGRSARMIRFFDGWEVCG